MADFKPQSAKDLAAAGANARPGTAEVATLKRNKSTTISEMGFAKRDLEQVPDRVRDLSVNDLEDFAKRMAGLPTRNPVVEKLSVEDIQGIEFLFAQEKNAILARVATQGATLAAAASVDVSCCCCTPCCCCAATETQPFAA